MKIDRILSTAGVCRVDSTKLRSYCNLMQGSLMDKWLFADDFVNSHVCFVRDDYLENMDASTLEKAQVIVILNRKNSYLSGYDYQISTPLTAYKIKKTLNEISQSVKFKPFLLEERVSKKSANKFKAAFSAIRKNFRGKKGRNLIEMEQKNRQNFITNLNKRIHSNELSPLKIVLLGSPGSGKTTAIQSINPGRALSSDVSATDSVASNKINTTVGIDYAEVNIKGLGSDKTRKLKLIGTPGQIKFNFIWDMVGKGADAFIILVDLSRPEPLSYLKFFKKFLRSELGSISLIYCALTHCDKYSGHIPSLIECIESEFPRLKGVYKIDPREKKDISILLSDIFPQIETSYNQKHNETEVHNINRLKKNNILSFIQSNK